MTEIKFQNNVMHEIGEIKKVVTGVKKEVDFIKSVFEDKFLSDEDKKAVDEALEAKKQNKLKSMKEVFS